MDLLDACSYHQLALHSAGRSRATLQLYLIYERRFLEFLEARKIAPTLEALNPTTARQAIMWFQQRQLGQRSGEVATEMFLNTLKTWANFLENEGVYEVSPLRRVARVKVRKVARIPYTRAEVNAILHAASESRMPVRDRLLVQLLLDTGARISEVAGLKCKNVRLDTRTVHVLGKGNKERVIPIGDPTLPDGGPLLRTLREWLRIRDRYAQRNPERSGDHLLLTFAGFPLTGGGGTEIVKRLGSVAGVNDAIPHRFRHSFATIWLTRYPGDEIGLRRVLGQVSTKVMNDYVHIAEADIAQRAGRVSPTSAWLNQRDTG